MCESITWFGFALNAKITGQNLAENWFVQNAKNMSENIFAEVYCPKFYPLKIFELNALKSRKKK